MTDIYNIVLSISIVYMIIKTAYKYNLDLCYNKAVLTLKNRILIKIIPEYFCLQCAITQLSLMVSTIIVLLQHLALSNIFLYTIIVASLTLMILTKEENDKSSPY